MRLTSNQAALLAPLAAIAILASCSSVDPPARTGASPATVGATTSTTPTPDYTLVTEAHLVGPGRWALRTVDPKAPLAVFDVPAGYQGRENIVWTHDEQDLVEHQGQIFYQAPTLVLNDPCNPDAPSRRMGPTVEDLADALVAQQRTSTTRPVPVTLGGYRGLYLELSSTEADFKACGPDGMGLWKAGDAWRAWDFPARDRYWILDIEGHRVLVTAMTPIGARGASVKRLTDVAEAITFVKPAP